MATQTYGGLSAQQRTFYEMTLLKRLLPYTPMLGEGSKGSIPKHNGTQTQWRAFASLSLATTALTEGVPPAETALSISTVTATVLQYGAWVKLSDLLVHQGIDQAWTETSELLGEQAGQSIHTVLINTLAGGTNVRYADAVANRASVTTSGIIDDAEVKKAVRTLSVAKVPRWPDNTYHALVHPSAAYDIQGMTLWQDVAKYSGGGSTGNGGPNILTGELGKIHGVKFMESTDAPIFAGAGSGGIDVYGAFFYGPNWFGIRDFAAQPLPGINPDNQRGVRIHAVPVESPDKADPLGQYGIEGWKTSFVAKILQEARGLRLEHAVTA